MESFRHFDVEQTDQFTTIRLRDPRLAETLLVTELHDELLEYVETRQPRTVIIDFTPVTYCSTAVINGLLRAKKRILTYGGRLALCQMRPPVRESYRFLNLDGTVFDILHSWEEALQHLEIESQPE